MYSAPTPPRRRLRPSSAGLASRRHAFGGFTLIEALLVIAAVVILAALLFPLLGRAKESSRCVKCVSNLKTLGEAFRVHAEQEGGEYPSAGQLKGMKWQRFWTSDIRACLSESERLSERNRSPDSPFDCPTCTKEPPDDVWGDYGINAVALPWRQITSPGVRVTNIQNPSGTVLLADAKSWICTGWGKPPSLDNLNCCHGGKANPSANACFFDGSVRSVSKSDAAKPEIAKRLMGVD
jgi:prepilin-type processing-associated H-X9-DG protein